MKFYLITSLLFLANFYVVTKIINNLFLCKLNIFITIIITSVLLIIQLIGSPLGSSIAVIVKPIFRIFDLDSKLYLTSYLTLGILSSLFTYILIGDIVRLIISIIFPLGSSVGTYYNMLFIPITVILTIFTVVLGVMQTLNGPYIEEVHVPIKNLPKNFDNFKIVQVSDLHVGSVIKHDYVNKVVNLVNNLKPNLIALTGDFVDGDVDSLQHDVSPLSQLKSTHGTYFVTGNHEYYSGAEAWINEFRKMDIKVLLNEHVLIKNQKEKIILAGVTDYSTKNNYSNNPSSPSKAIANSPLNLIKILLAHQPSSYLEAHESGFNLQLSGHTHAGQYFPFTMIIRFFHKYYKGLNMHDGMWIYINRGTGYWGPPLRFGAPSEISLITLKAV